MLFPSALLPTVRALLAAGHATATALDAQDRLRAYVWCVPFLFSKNSSGTQFRRLFPESVQRAVGGVFIFLELVGSQAARSDLLAQHRLSRRLGARREAPLSLSLSLDTAPYITRTQGCVPLYSPTQTQAPDETYVGFAPRWTERAAATPLPQRQPQQERVLP